jgi:hypothetical protein
MAILNPIILATDRDGERRWLRVFVKSPHHMPPRIDKFEKHGGRWLCAGVFYDNFEEFVKLHSGEVTQTERIFMDPVSGTSSRVEEFPPETLYEWL